MKKVQKSGRTRISIIILNLLLFSQVASAESNDTHFQAASDKTTLIMIRHAERDAGYDPPLNAQGVRRSLRLTELFDQSGITRILIPDLKRNVETVGPLAEALGIDPITYPIEKVKDSSAFAEDVIRKIKSDFLGETVLFVGNQTNPDNNGIGNLQEVYRQLGGEGIPMTRYSDMYIFIVPREGKSQIIKGFSGFNP